MSRYQMALSDALTAHLVPAWMEPEPSLRRRARVHREIVHESPTPIFMVDVGSRCILDANPAFARLLGWRQHELIGLPLHDVDSGTAAAVDEQVLQVVAQHNAILGERTYRRADESTVTVEASASMILHGESTALCFFVKDVTGRKEAEAARAEREKELAHVQKHEAVGRLATGVAHEFNNLIGAVLLSAELLRRDEDPLASLEKYLSTIEEAGHRARNLTRQLLAFDGRQVLTPETVELEAVVGRMRELIRRSLPEGVELRMDLAREPATIHADATQLSQVLLNLVANARKAMPDGGTLTVATSRVEAVEEGVAGKAEGPHAVLVVADTGVGMDPATRRRIFEPFFTTRPPGEGSGLGLATVYGIVRQAGGTLQVESEPGLGTTFRIYLPLRREAPAAPVADRPADAPGTPGGSETVLLVEDEASVRVLAARLLRSLGYHVVEATCAEEALEIHERLRPSSGPHPVDLVVSDVIMPGVSGPEAVRRLLAERQDLKVLFVSGYPAGFMETEFPGGRRPPLLPKPYTRDELAVAVRRLLDD